MNKWIIVGLVLVVSSCSSAGKKKTNDPAESTSMPEFERGLNALEREDYGEAAEIFDSLIVQKPASEVDLVTLFNSGAAHEGLGNCNKALDRYRQVGRSSAGKFRRVEGEAYFRASLMYECLGDDTKAITALLDAQKRSKELALEVRVAEIPARLAAAYARVGNRDKALKYFNQASRGLKQVVSNGGRNVQLDNIAKILFLMGRLSEVQRRTEGNPMGYVQSISIQQPYLLQSMEMKKTTWSKKAEDDLRLAYENIWRFKFKSVVAQREFYIRVLQTINELRKIRMPDSDMRVNNIFALLDRTETRIQGEMAIASDKTPLTPEAESRQSLRKTGRLVSPEGKPQKGPVRK